MIVTLFGQSAVTVGGVANRLPEVLVGSAWKAATTLSAAQRHLSNGSTSVRLRADPRLLAEDIFRERAIGDHLPTDPHLLKARLLEWSEVARDSIQRLSLTMVAEAITA